MLDVESGLAATGTQKSYPTNYTSNYLTGQGAASKTVAPLGNLDSLVPELSGFYPHEQFDKQITTTKSHILNNDFTQGTQVFTNNQPDDVANISNYFYDYGDFYLRKWAAPSVMAAASANNYEVYIDIINKLQEESPSKLVDLVIIRNNFNPFPTGNFEPTGKNESMLAHNNLMFQAQSEILSTYRNDKNVRIGYVRNDNWQPTECIWLDQNNQNADTTNVGGYWSLVKELQAAVKGLESARPNARKAILYIDNLYGPLTITGSSSTNDLSYTGGAAVDFYQRQNNFYFKQMLPEIKKIALEDIHISTAVYGINADEAVNNPYFTNLVSLMDTVSSDNWTQLIPFGSDQATINQLLEEVVGNIFVPQPKTFAIEEETGEYLSSVGHLGGLGNTTNATYNNISTYPIDTAANTVDWTKPTALPVEHAEITGHLSATGNQTFSIKNLNVSPKQLVRLHYTLQLNQGTRNGLFRQVSGNDSEISFNEKTYQNLPNASVRNFGGGHTIQVTKTDELGNPVPNVPYALYEKQIDQNGVEKEVLLYTAPTILQTINPGTANERQVAIAEFPENILHISHNYSGLEGNPPDFWEANMIGWSNQYIVREVTDSSLYPFPESILPYENDIVFRGGSYQVGNEAPKVRLIEKNGQTSANISNRLTMKLTSENDFYLVNIDLINDLSPLSLELKKFVGYSDTNLVNKDTALAGAEFRFFKVDGTQEVEQASGTSQSDGTVAFSNNQQPFEITEPGTYRIRETTTPKGYRDSFLMLLVAVLPIGNFLILGNGQVPFSWIITWKILSKVFASLLDSIVILAMASKPNT
ncbi:prealbumin-like fold domain-containing protein [Enterococcus sp. LJL90]